MIKLNLTNINDSDIKYRLIDHKDGQQDIVLDLDNINIVDLVISIHSNFRSFRDLELIICATTALRRFFVKNINLHIPYLLGARSDRLFEMGGTSYLVDVIAPILNSLNFKYIKVLNVHSDVAAACIKNFVNTSQNVIVHNAIHDYRNKRSGLDLSEIVLVSPDAGALKKTFDVAENLGIKHLVIANKHRDLQTLEVTNTTITGLTNNIKDKTFFIIDDICDGGRTFINLAKELKAQGVIGNIVLVVTHGIFSYGVDTIYEHINYIYTTNSYSDKVFEYESDTFSILKTA